jgi:hypothetical protein
MGVAGRREFRPVGGPAGRQRPDTFNEPARFVARGPVAPEPEAPRRGHSVPRI